MIRSTGVGIMGYAVVVSVAGAQLLALSPPHEPHPVGEQPVAPLPFVQLTVSTTAASSDFTQASGPRR
jgi:hypothetical protein